MDFVRVGDVVFHARRDGQPGAAPLVLVAPWGADLRIWQRLVAYLEDRFFLVRFDQRGHGLSGLDDHPWPIERLGQDLAGLLDQLDTGPAVICGLGTGGLTALALGAERPELVAGLALLGTGARVEPQATWRRRLAVLHADGIAAIVDDVMREWFPEGFRIQRRDEVACWRAMLLRTPPRAVQGLAGAVVDADLKAAAKTVRAPTLCVVGTEESALVRAAAEDLAENTASLGVQLIEGAAHMIPITHSGPLAARLMTFCEGVSRG